jgi:hypothetical protein
MELKDVVSIGGKPGLYQIVGRRKNGLIVETLDKAKRRMPTNITQKVSVLEDISIYTIDGEARLREVFRTIFEKEKGGTSVPDKAAGKDDLSSFMSEILPDYDEERVYQSDIKKLCQWYYILKEETNLEELVAEQKEESEPEGESSSS